MGETEKEKLKFIFFFQTFVSHMPKNPSQPAVTLPPQQAQFVLFGAHPFPQPPVPGGFAAAARRFQGRGITKRRKTMKARGRVGSLAKKAAAAALAAAITGYAGSKIYDRYKASKRGPLKIGKRITYRNAYNAKAYKPQSASGRRRRGRASSGRGRRGKLKTLAKAALSTAVVAATLPLADRYFQPQKTRFPVRLLNPRDNAASGGGITSYLLPAAAAAAAYKYHAPSRAAMDAGWNILKTIGPSMASAYRGARGRGIGDKLKKAAKWAIPAALAVGAAHHYRHPINQATKWTADAVREGVPTSQLPGHFNAGWRMGKLFHDANIPKPDWSDIYREIKTKPKTGKGIWGRVKKATKLAFTPRVPRFGGRGYKAGVSRMKRLQPNPRKARKGTPRRPRSMPTIRGRGAWDDIVSGFSMPFQAIGGLAKAAAPAAPLLAFL